VLEDALPPSANRELTPPQHRQAAPGHSTSYGDITGYEIWSSSDFMLHGCFYGFDCG
jgi:hypothetical protein